MIVWVLASFHFWAGLCASHVLQTQGYPMHASVLELVPANTPLCLAQQSCSSEPVRGSRFAS